ncbi:MAG: 23S rRNA (pseudouridine(1915)-N(3))-methyltransferase RlmH [Candidatus Kapabacteria bacterium]|nr:23S rRNA (pseudouridine(1915)-N(3))-methyltransferase RlmH [Candidatus Kapabacteria bacterium]
MTIVLIAIGKTEASFIQEAIVEYINRIKRYSPFEFVIVPAVKNAHALPDEVLKQKEGEALLAKCQPNDHIILLDEHGKERTSVMFSQHIQRLQNTGIKRVVFMIGGAYGFSQELHQRAYEKISLSQMTFSHQMVRMIFLEQLYRAFTILKGEPYHHE